MFKLHLKNLPKLSENHRGMLETTDKDIVEALLLRSETNPLLGIMMSKLKTGQNHGTLMPR
jgi:hypothetical protein